MRVYLRLYCGSAADAFNHTTILLETTLAGNGRNSNMVIPQLPFDFSKTLTQNTIYFFRDNCRGLSVLLYLRLVARTLSIRTPSAAAEAFRQLTARGYFDPDIHLTIKVLVLPTILFSIVFLLAPPTMCWIMLRFFGLEDMSRSGQSIGHKAYLLHWTLLENQLQQSANLEDLIQLVSTGHNHLLKGHQN